MNWISVENRLPDLKEKKIFFSSDDVLAFDGKNMFVASRWKLKPSSFYTDPKEFFKSTICDCCNQGIGKITHWMPLPEPPKQ